VSRAKQVNFWAFGFCSFFLLPSSFFMRLTMAVAVITGAAQGIGRRIAEVLAERGYALALNDLRPPAETIAALAKHGVDTLELVGDVTDERTVQEFAARVVDRWQRADVLVNNAGISCIARAENTTPEVFRRVVDVNLVGPFLMAHAFGPLMLAAGSGSIVNIASIAGLLGIAERSAYNASKHGLIGLTRTMAAEWGGRGVRCNAVCPGWV
jgi:NAD(P)-dependent dehydrogenase (short-subunit alcohol dehydrogenase family)